MNKERSGDLTLLNGTKELEAKPFQHCTKGNSSPQICVADEVIDGIAITQRFSMEHISYQRNSINATPSEVETKNLEVQTKN